MQRRSWDVVFLELPSGLSEAELSELIERARYETFTTPGANGRVVMLDVAIYLGTLLVVTACNVALWVYTPLATAGVFLKALLPALIIGAGFFAGFVLQQYVRAAILAPKRRELGAAFLAGRGVDDRGGESRAGG